MDERPVSGIPRIPVIKDKTEGEASSKEFASLTKEDLGKIEDLYYNLKNKFPEEIPGLELYTGIYSNVGEGNIFYNSHMTLDQLQYALAMTRHPVIKEIAKPGFDKSKFDAKILVENKVMAGMKILDLGCGPYPVFARCCRAMGADVWTVDLRPVGELYFEEKLFTEEQRDLEVQRHIQIDLSSELAPRTIKDKSGGDFNLAAEVQLRGDEFFEGKNIGMVLLKKGGVYYEAFGQELKE